VLQNRLHDLAFRLRYIARMGPWWTLKRMIRRGSSFVLWLLLLPLTIALHLAGFRHVTAVTDRVGHLALEPDCLLKEQALGRIARRKWILLAPPGGVANEHLLEYWARHFIVVRNALACFVIASMSGAGVMRFDASRYVRVLGGTQGAYRAYAEWGERAPVLELTSEDDAWGRTMLERLGVPQGAWFACVHAREAGFSPTDEEVQSYRNSRIENAFEAIREITGRGGWVVRIGDPSMRALPPMPRVVDYARHPLKSPRLDVYLCARARFILGSTSGIALVGTVFGVPCALANVIPVSTLAYGPRDVSIPMLLRSDELGRSLTLGEILGSDVGNYLYNALYEKKGIRPQENTPGDIRDLAAEMLDRLDGTYAFDEADADRQRQARALWKPGHYGYGSAATIGASFLRNHPELLGRA